jgi:hypothetical protein
MEKAMKLLTGLGAVALALSAACSSMPGGAGKDADDHAAHHPPDAAAASSAPAGYDQQMKMMHEMHQKMAAAKTREERATLMKEHMKTMQDGMAMMGQMHGGTGAGKGSMPMDAETMKRHMDMMEMMMQMMIDRQAMTPPATP